MRPAGRRYRSNPDNTVSYCDLQYWMTTTQKKLTRNDVSFFVRSSSTARGQSRPMIYFCGLFVVESPVLSVQTVPYRSSVKEWLCSASVDTDLHLIQPSTETCRRPWGRRSSKAHSSTALSSKREQCRAVSRRRKLGTGLFH